MAWFDAVLGDFGSSAALLRGVAERDGLGEDLAISIARVIRGSGDGNGAVAYAGSTWEANPAWGSLREELVNFLVADDRFDDAYAVARRAVDAAPDDPIALRRLAAMLVESVRADLVQEGLGILDRLIAANPDNPLLILARAVGLQRLERFADSERELRAAIDRWPGEWRLHQALADLLMATDRQKEAGPIMKRAGEMRVKALRK